MGYKNKEDLKNYQKRYYENHKEEIKKYRREYFCTHREKFKENLRNWEKNNPEKAKERNKRYREKNKERINENRRKNNSKYKIQQKEYHRKIKLQVFMHYCNGRPKCQCSKCNETNIKFLQMDHINGGGAKHRRQLGGSGFAIYRWLIDNNFPSGYQVLCANCNWGKQINSGVCPHNE